MDGRRQEIGRALCEISGGATAILGNRLEYRTFGSDLKITTAISPVIKNPLQ